jgi:hypothetical protein
MGARANYAIVEGSRTELYYDHWGAAEISRDLLLDGPTVTLARIRSLEPQDANDPSDWLDDVEGEGGLTLDLDQRRIIWFDSDGIKPRLACCLFEKLWPGWMPVWSPYGMSGIARAAGVKLQFTEDTYGDTPDEDDDLELGDQEYETAVSVRFKDGAVWSVAADALPEDIALLSPKKVAKRVTKAMLRGNRPIWEDPAWQALGVEDPEQTWAWGDQGMFIDLPAKEVSWWSTVSDLFPIIAFATNWPRFTIRCLGDNYEWHEEAARTSGLQPPLRTILRQEQDTIENKGERPSSADPGALMLNRMTQLGDDWEVNPWATQHAPSTGPGARDAILAELSRLLESPTPSVRPARFIDLNGAINQP